jgi:hypothetical protein
MESLTELYKRECIANRFIKELEVEEIKKDFNQDMPNDFNEETGIVENIPFHREHNNRINLGPDLKKIEEEYVTDEEDQKIIEEILGLDSIEKEDKDIEQKIDKPQIHSKQNLPAISKQPSRMGNMSEVSMSVQMKRPMGIPSQMKRPMGMPTINPAAYTFNANAAQMMFGYGAKTGIQGMPIYPFMTPEMLKLSKMQQENRGDKDKGKKKKRRDKKYDRKDKSGNRLD